MIDFSSASGGNLFAVSVAASTNSIGMNQAGGNQTSSPSGNSLLSQFTRTVSTGSASSMFSLGPLGPPPLDMNEFPSLNGSNITNVSDPFIIDCVLLYFLMNIFLVYPSF